MFSYILLISTKKIAELKNIIKDILMFLSQWKPTFLFQILITASAETL